MKEEWNCGKYYIVAEERPLESTRALLVMQWFFAVLYRTEPLSLICLYTELEFLKSLWGLGTEEE